MNKRFDSSKYGSGDYDDFFSLRPPGFLVASMIFLSRDLILFVLGPMAKGVTSLFEDAIPTEHVWIRCLAAVPAMLVLAALLMRGPAAHVIVRWVWNHGRALLSVSVLSQIAVAAAPYWPDVRRWLGGSLVEKALVLTEVVVIGYVLLSSRAKHTFLDFPVA